MLQNCFYSLSLTQNWTTDWNPNPTRVRLQKIREGRGRSDQGWSDGVLKLASEETKSLHKRRKISAQMHWMASTCTKGLQSALKRHGFHLKSACRVTSEVMACKSSGWSEIRSKIGRRLSKMTSSTIRSTTTLHRAIEFQRPRQKLNFNRRSKDSSKDGRARSCHVSTLKSPIWDLKNGRRIGPLRRSDVAPGVHDSLVVFDR